MNSQTEILIVEDNPTQRAHLRQMLENQGYAVVAVDNGKAALDALSAADSNPALVISDIVMPELDGFGLCKAIKAIPRLADLPVILVTHLSGPEDVIRGLECGADNFITKPYDGRYLSNRINYILANRMLRSQGQGSMGLEIEVSGHRHLITAERQQILDLLISTYEESGRLNETLQIRQHELETSYKTLDSLYRIAEDLNAGNTVREVADSLLDHALRLPGVEACWLLLGDGIGDMQLLGARGLPANLSEMTNVPACECQRVLRTIGSAAPIEIAHCAWLGNSTSTSPPKRHVSVPLRVASETVGILNLVCDDLGKEGQLAIISTMGHHVGAALVRAKLHDELDARVQAKTAALLVSERRFHEFADIASDWLWETDAEHRFTFFSERSEKLAGVTHRDALGRRREDTDIIDREAPGWQAHLADRDAHRPFRNFVYGRRDPDGNPYFRISGTPLFDAEHRFLGYRGVATNVTEEVHANQRAFRDRALLRDAVESTPGGFILYDRDERLVLCNTWYLNNIPSLAPFMLPGMTAESFFRASAKLNILGDMENAAAQEAWVRRRLQYFRAATGFFERQLADGRWWHLVERHTSDGGTLSLLTDVTEHRRMEDQVRHAQKMDAIGYLTAGLAHDFNNILTVVIGNLDLLCADATPGSEVLDLASVARSAALHGADLTRSLLAIARRQPLQPRLLDVNEMVEKTGKILDRLVGENIALVVHCAPEACLVEVDPAQLESCLLNLHSNARDAMPTGGTVTIETAEVRLDQDYAAENLEVVPGSYVSISVSDTGHGMTTDVLAKAFDPFFTTKEQGKGTGLGLAMCLGFIKQSGGHAKIYSELGKGTCIKLYLPNANRHGDTASDDLAGAEIPGGVGELVLIVEDNPEIRDVAVRRLQSLGYRTIVAARAPEALAILRGRTDVALVFTDIIMPGGASGAELAREVRIRWPKVAVLLTSGFPARGLSSVASIADEPLLTKPYGKWDLAGRVREALQRGETHHAH